MGCSVTVMKRHAPAVSPQGRLSLRIDLPGGRVGPGRVRLLEAIAEHGSISAAGRALGISYRRAWEMVDGFGKLAGAPVVRTRPGGTHGGGAELTELGRALVADYRAIEVAADRAVRPLLAAMVARTRPPEDAPAPQPCPATDTVGANTVGEGTVGEGTSPR